ncbi:50S ribosomal protein L25/general stress protein Ctc [Wenzhouxiangella sp. XN79A]|uniref:50S ribosomal protein L25/general stress protein Ctc n=1 Tax=Wenzhouxiangella sp. XN79A TaxID=2724193 RepID=UPI00144A59A0|nr:50S ribosomal protein L25/general stress protein Ctc [Wenzhouxiangella sp. XN79A]NKI34104.1 50S ribosomal protein L25/general stress protein Ctc [Wenzhouxiangella sp. XN79A]
MSKIYKVPAEVREDVGKGASRRLRHANKVPAVLYGAGRDPVALTLEHDFILHAADEEAFHASILELTVGDGRKQKVVLRDLQRHPYKLRIMHVDFLRVKDDQPIRMSVPVHFINEETSPAGKKGGVVISYQMMDVEIEALPKDLPEYIEVDLGKLEPGASVTLRDLSLPEGVMIPAVEYDEDYNAALVTAVFVRAGQGSGELAAEADAALAEGAEPEVGEAEDASEGEQADESEGESGASSDDENKAE